MKIKKTDYGNYGVPLFGRELLENDKDIWYRNRENLFILSSLFLVYMCFFLIINKNKKKITININNLLLKYEGILTAIYITV